MAIVQMAGRERTLGDGECALAVRTVKRRVGNELVDVQVGRLLPPRTQIFQGQSAHWIGTEQDLRDYAAANGIELSS